MSDFGANDDRDSDTQHCSVTHELKYSPRSNILKDDDFNQVNDRDEDEPKPISINNNGTVVDVSPQVEEALKSQHLHQPVTVNTTNKDLDI